MQSPSRTLASYPLIFLLFNLAVAQAQNDPGQQAVALIQKLYDTHTTLRGNDLPGVPGTPGLASEFFDPDIVQPLSEVAGEFDPVFAGAAEIDNPRVLLDPALGVLRGTAFVVAEFDTPGGARSLNYLVRRHPAVDGLRILEIEGDGWTLSGLLAGEVPAPGEPTVATTAAPDEGESEAEAPTETAQATAPVPADTADSVFPYREDFGAELAPVWRVLNPDPNSYLPEDDGLFVLVSGGEDRPGNVDAANIFTLPTALPAADFDLSLDLSLDASSGHDRVYLGLRDSEANVLYASLYVLTKGCGASLYLRVLNQRPIAGQDDPLTTHFTRNLLDGPFADNICTGGRAYGDAVLAALVEEGGTLTLSRRGRRLTASFEMTLPPRDDAPAETARVETFAVSRTELVGEPFFMLGQSRQARNREGTARFRRFAFQPAGEE